MRAVSDFYNIISGCEAKNDLLMTCVVIEIIWLSICYDRECMAQESSQAPNIVIRQSEMLLQQNFTFEETNLRLS